MFDYHSRSISRTNSIDDSREPYELVIDKNLRSRAKRLQDDTREELSKVLERVENVIIFKFRNQKKSILKKFLKDFS